MNQQSVQGTNKLHVISPPSQRSVNSVYMSLGLGTQVQILPFC